MDNKQEGKADTQPDYTATRLPISYRVCEEPHCCKNCHLSLMVGIRRYCSFDMSVDGLGLWASESEFDKRLVGQWKDTHFVSHDGICDQWEARPEPGEVEPEPCVE